LLFPTSIMNILLDTSVFLPGFRHPNLPRKLFWKLVEEGFTPCLTDYIIEELRENIKEQFSTIQKEIALELLLSIVATGKLMVLTWDEYRHNIIEALGLVPEKDAPILACVMLEKMALFLTNDTKDFLKNKKLQQTHSCRAISYYTVGIHSLVVRYP